MSDARDRLRRSNVQVMAALAAGASALFPAAVARADEPVAASISVGGESAAPQKDAAPAAEEAVDPKVLNPANYEFALVSVGAYQSWSLAGRWLHFGAGGGLGPTLYRVGTFGQTRDGIGLQRDKSVKWDPNLEIAYANAFLRISPNEYVDIDVGPRIALGSALFDVYDAPQSVFATGAYVDLRVGTSKIKLGPRFQVERAAYANFTETGWRLTPLMLRVMQ